MSEHKAANVNGNRGGEIWKHLSGKRCFRIDRLKWLNLSRIVWNLIHDTSVKLFLLPLLSPCLCFCPCPIIWFDEPNSLDSCWLQMLLFPQTLAHSSSLNKWIEWQEMMVTTVQSVTRKLCIIPSLTKQTRKEPASSVFVYARSL